MIRFLLLMLPVALMTTPALAGIDETINSITAPIAVWVGAVVFFKIPLFAHNRHWLCCG